MTQQPTIRKRTVSNSTAYPGLYMITGIAGVAGVGLMLMSIGFAIHLKSQGMPSIAFVPPFVGMVGGLVVLVLAAMLYGIREIARFAGARR